MFTSLTVVVAAFNEEECIAQFVEGLLDFLQKEAVDSEVILVNDGSIDQTGHLINQIAQENNQVISLHLEKNSGMGAALLKGYEKASKDWITMLPADGQIQPMELKKLFELSKESDVVTSLYVDRKYSSSRRILSFGLRVLTALIVGTRARTEGTYLIRSEVLRKLNPVSQSFLLNLEIPIRAKRQGFRVKTAWIYVSQRLAGKSKAITWRRVFQTFQELFHLRLQFEKERWKTNARLKI